MSAHFVFTERNTKERRPMAIKQTLIKTLSYGTIVDHTTERGFTMFLVLDRRGYCLTNCQFRYGGYGWPTRAEALRSALGRDGDR